MSNATIIKSDLVEKPAETTRDP